MLGFLDKIPYGPRWLKRTAFFACILFILYTAAGFLLVPAVVKPMLEKELTKVLNGRQFSVDSVYFNPLLLHAELEKVQIAKRDGGGDLLKVDLLRAAISPASITNFAPVLSYLEVTKPQVELAFLGKGTYSISDLMQDRAQPKGPAEDPKIEDTTLFPLVIYEFMIKDGAVSLEDHKRGQTHVVSGLNLDVPFTSTLQGDREHPIKPVLEFVLNGDPVKLEGTTVPFGEDLRTEFHLGVVDLDVDRYWDYVPFATKVKLEKGEFSSDLSLLLQRPKGAPIEMVLQGDGVFRDVNLTGPDGKTLFGLKSIAFKLGQVRPLDGVVSFDSISVDAPYLHLIRLPDGKINLLSYLSEGESASAAAVTKTHDVEAGRVEKSGNEQTTVAGASGEEKVPANKEMTSPQDAGTGTQTSATGDAEQASAPADVPTPEKTAIPEKAVSPESTAASLAGEANNTNVSEGTGTVNNSVVEKAPASSSVSESASGNAASEASGDTSATVGADTSVATTGEVAVPEAGAGAEAGAKAEAGAEAAPSTESDASGGSVSATAPESPSDLPPDTASAASESAGKTGNVDELSGNDTKAKSTPSVSAKKAESPAQFRLEIAKAELKAGRFDWEDRFVDGGFARTYGSLNVSLVAVGKDQTNVGFTVSASAEGGESYTAEGRVSLTDFSVEAQCAAQGVSLPVYEPYFGNLLPVDIAKGVLGAKTSITLKDGVLAIGSTDATLDDLDVALEDGKAGLTMRHVALMGGELNLADGIIQVRSLSLLEPAVRMTLDKDLNPPSIALGTEDATGEASQSGKDSGGAIAPPGASVSTDSKMTTAESGPDGAANAGGQEETPMVFTLKGLKIDDASVLLRGGRSGGELLHIKGANLGAENISTKPGSRIRFNGVVPVPKGGKMLLVGDVVADTQEGSLRLSMDDVALSSFNALVGQFANLRLDKGEADMEMELAFAPAKSEGASPELDLKGGLSLTGLQASLANEQKELGNLELIDIQGVSLSSKDGILNIDNIGIRSPATHYVREADGSSNFALISLAADEAESKAAAQAGADEQGTEKTQPSSDAATAGENAETADGGNSMVKKVVIGKASLEAGHILLTDKTLTPAFILQAKDIDGEIARRKDDSGEDFKIDAVVSGGDVHAEGMFKLLTEDPTLKGVATVKGMDLLPFTPFAVREVGYPVLRGRFNADVKVNVEGKKVNADNTFVLRQFELGNPVPGEKKPQGSVKFGLSLLRDASGDISLNIPVSGELGDPNLRLGGIIFKALSNVLVGALTSPFSILGSIVGSLNSAELEYVAFGPGSIALSAQARQKLDDISAALVKRPRIIVDIDGVANMEADGAGLVEFLFMQKLRRLKFDDLPVAEQRKTQPWLVKIAPGNEYEELLQEVFTRETGKGRKTVQIMEEELKGRITVTPEDVERLAMFRARAVERYLLDKDPALKDRVFVVQNVDNKKSKKGLPPGRVDLSLR